MHSPILIQRQNTLDALIMGLKYINPMQKKAVEDRLKEIEELAKQITKTTAK